jgi:hypothetical protein
MRVNQAQNMRFKPAQNMPFKPAQNMPFNYEWPRKMHPIVVTHIACARVDIFDHYEITVS